MKAEETTIREDVVAPNDGVAAKLTLEIEKKKLEIMKRESALTSRIHLVR